MNQKIKQLAERAEIKIQYDHDSEMDEFSGDSVEVLEKFAGLLIQDILGCYQAIDNGNKVEGTDNFVKAVLKRYKGKK